jgi:hypothetical protein
MIFKKTSGKEFSFEKHEFGPGADYYLGQENNTTAHFNKFNLMSRTKEPGSSHRHILNSNNYSELKDNRPNYHCHYANEDKVTPEAFTLEPSFNAARISLSIMQDGRVSNNSNFNSHHHHSLQPSSSNTNLKRSIAPFESRTTVGNSDNGAATVEILPDDNSGVITASKNQNRDL